MNCNHVRFDNFGNGFKLGCYQFGINLETSMKVPSAKLWLITYFAICFWLCTVCARGRTTCITQKDKNKGKVTIVKII